MARNDPEDLDDLLPLAEGPPGNDAQDLHVANAADEALEHAQNALAALLGIPHMDDRVRQGVEDIQREMERGREPMNAVLLEQWGFLNMAELIRSGLAIVLVCGVLSMLPAVAVLFPLLLGEE